MVLVVAIKRNREELSELADQINKISGCQFIWITDGVVAISQKQPKKSYEHQNHLLTIQDLEFDI